MSSPDSPEIPPVPRYGEYSPSDGTPNSTPSTPPTQDRSGLPPYGSPSYAPVEKRPLTADRIVSTILLVIGFFVVIYFVLSAVYLEAAIQLAYDQNSLGTYEPTATLPIVQATIIISHIAIYILVTVLTIALIRKRRVSFWLPLTGGFLGIIIFLVAVAVILFTDPTLLDAMQSPQPLQ
jgi:hypothetical protein